MKRGRFSFPSPPSHWQSLGGSRASASAGDDGGAVAERVQRATKLIDDMIQEIGRDMLAEDAASYLTDTPAEDSEAGAVRRAVVARIEYLDADFLAAVGAFIDALTSRGQDPGLTALLGRIRDEVLQQVGLRLPPVARVLDAALRQVGERTSGAPSPVND